MTKKEVVKRNTSGIQVIKTLLVLLENNYSMSELISRLNANEKEPVFNNNVVSKYINTCRYCGFNIPKIHNKYYVASMPFGLDLSVKEMGLLYKLQSFSQKILSTKAVKILDEFMANLNKYSNKQIFRIEKDTVNITYERFYKAIRQRRKVLLMFKTKTSLECIPVDIIENNDKKYFKIVEENNEQLISVDRISGLEILDKKFRNEAKDVVFKLYGGLASRYSLRENETIQENKLPEYIVVLNKDEDKNELFSRLLRYDNLCEIISPQDYREEMKAIIEKMLLNYGE